jgi:hypothetical protein
MIVDKMFNKTKSTLNTKPTPRTYLETLRDISSEVKGRHDSISIQFFNSQETKSSIL